MAQAFYERGFDIYSVDIKYPDQKLTTPVIFKDKIKITPEQVKSLLGLDLKNIELKNKVFKQEFVYQASVIIVCCGDSEAYPREKLERGFDDPFQIRAVRDVSIAAQNLVLRATELGLGTCYISWRHKGRIKKVLGIPKSYVVPFVITLGYPAERPKARLRKNIKEFLLNL